MKFPELGKNYYLAFAFSSVVLTVTLLAVYVLVPSFRSQILEEGMFLENMQAAILLLAAAVGGVGILRLKTKRYMLMYLPIPVMTLLAFLDEVSYGQGDDKPLHLFGYDVDGVHDVFTICFKLWRDNFGIIGYSAGAILIGAAAGAAFLLRKRYMPEVMKAIRTYPAFDFLRYALILCFCSMLFDLHIFSNSIGFAFEEILEADGAIALLFAAGAILCHAKAERQNTQS